MDIDETADFSPDPQTPSGPWRGYWVQGDRLEHMKLELIFIGRRVIGEGFDPIGAFDVIGTYEQDIGCIEMQKQYRDKHDVWYRGRLVNHEFKGTWWIQGTPARGDWCIWPIEDSFEITHLEIETENGPIVIHGEVEDEEDEPEEDDS